MADARGSVADDARAPSPFALPIVASVFVGGVLGTATRVALAVLFGFGGGAPETGWTAYAPLPGETYLPAGDLLFWAPDPLSDIALGATLVANLLGSLVLGFVTGAHWPARLEWLRAGLGAGFCGAFTTFSLVMLAFAALDFNTPWAWALLVVGLVGGLLLAAVGLQVGRGMRPVPPAGPPGDANGTGGNVDPTAERDS